MGVCGDEHHIAAGGADIDPTTQCEMARDPAPTVHGGETPADPMSPTNPELHRQRVRFNDNMRRHVWASDKDLTDAEQSVAVINRWRADRGLALIDPNE